MYKCCYHMSVIGNGKRCDAEVTNEFTSETTLLPLPLCEKHYGEMVEWNTKQPPRIYSKNKDSKILESIFLEVMEKQVFKEKTR